MAVIGRAGSNPAFGTTKVKGNMPKLLLYISSHALAGSLLRMEALVKSLARWGWDWEIMVRSPLALPEWGYSRDLLWDRVPIPEPPLSQDEGRLKRWVEEWVKGWDLWVEGEEEVVKGFDPLVILSDMAPQPLVLARKLGVPGWFIGHFNWFAYLAQFIPFSGALDEVGLAYEGARVAFVPPLSWGQGIFPLLQEIPLMGGTLDDEEVRSLRLRAMKKGFPLYMDSLLDTSREWIKGLPSLGPIAWLEGRVGFQAAQLALVEARYSSLTMALRGQVPCLVYYQEWEPMESMAREMGALGVALALKRDEWPLPEEVSTLLNKALDAYKTLSSLYRLEGSQFVMEQLESLSL